MISKPSHAFVTPQFPPAEFISEITAVQRRLYGFVRTLVVERDTIEDVVQETNLTLWEQFDRFRPGTDFAAWACRVAWFKVLEQRRARKLSKLRFSDAVVEKIALEAVEETDVFERERLALLTCIDALNERHRTVMAMYYESELTVAEIAVKLDRNRNAIGQVLHRLRLSLRECIRRRLGESANGAAS